MFYLTRILFVWMRCWTGILYVLQVIRWPCGWKDQFSLKSCSPNRPLHTAVIIFLFFILHAIGVPIDRAVPKFFFSYARDAPCMSVKDCSALNSTPPRSSHTGMIIGNSDVIRYQGEIHISGIYITLSDWILLSSKTWALPFLIILHIIALSLHIIALSLH